MSVTPAEGFRIYRDYYYYGNSLKTSPKEMADIVNQHKDLISSWQKSIQTTADDENKYVDFDDSEYAQFLEEGREEGKDATDGYSGKTGGQIANGTSTAVGAAGGLALSCIGEGAGAAMKQGYQNIKGVFNGEGSKAAAGGKIIAWVAAALAIATAAKYWITRPNKDAAKACEDLQPVLTEKQGELSGAQSDMQTASENLAENYDEAAQANEQANSDIEAQKTLHDFYMKSYLKLKAKIDAGEPLTKDEKNLFKTIIGYINEAGININNISEKNSEHLADLHDDMGDFEVDYETAAGTIAQAEGLTDYAAGFDKATKTMCYVEAVSQGLNVISGLTSGLRLIGQFFNPAAWVVGGAAIAASVSSGIAAAQQIKLAGTVSEEIDMREVTEDVNVNTQEVYDVEIENFEAYMAGVEGLETYIPQELPTVEDSSLPANTVDTGKNKTKNNKKSEE